MKMKGHLRKMKVDLQTPVDYSLVLDDQLLPLNDKLGEPLKLTHTGQIHCVACGRLTKKSFNQGYCFPCVRSLAQCDMCIVRPELCHYDEGTCREPEWGDKHCMQPHYVYLSNTSGAKVGITRHTQIPTRWIDQGAVQALPIMEVSSRLLSGLVEVELKNYVDDKTQWQRMLKGGIEERDLEALRDEMFEESEREIEALQERFGEDAIERLEYEDLVDIEYPVLEYPKAVKSMNFDKTPEVSGVLKGIKGQYLIFDTGVINMRKFGGYEIEVEV
ncbi:MAG: FIG00953934: hypothetical protein [uncultured Thiotrichaceae bacterium]|uniref:DUF2797 domain-containing protein n=1 Tax=uncultured Thiotrichaceae bacterium TaxID=298394 RepID=A0A6S6TA41_9GAMM|nr:MAG: FIG00953934: hypothetical protein [uncultured Thiotrichaceae bacterium]